VRRPLVDANADEVALAERTVPARPVSSVDSSSRQIGRPLRVTWQRVIGTPSVEYARRL
jgi:hypothetical protein